MGGFLSTDIVALQYFDLFCFIPRFSFLPDSSGPRAEEDRVPVSYEAQAVFEEETAGMQRIFVYQNSYSIFFVRPCDEAHRAA